MKDICEIRTDTNALHESASRLCSSEAFDQMRRDSLARVRTAAELPTEMNPAAAASAKDARSVTATPATDASSKTSDGTSKASEAPSSSIKKALEPVTDPKILTDVSRRTDGKKIEPVYLGVDNSASYLGDDGKKHIATGVPAWLDRPAAEAFVKANEKLASRGKRIEIASESGADNAINSAGRTHTQQRIASGIHARPGNSAHEQGRGLDVRNFDDPEVKAALREAGFVQGNLRRPNVPIRGDAWHFSYAGPPAVKKHKH